MSKIDSPIKAQVSCFNHSDPGSNFNVKIEVDIIAIIKIVMTILLPFSS